MPSDEGADQRDGARHLQCSIERFLISPPAALLATKQLRPGDLLIIDRQPQEERLETRGTSRLLSLPSPNEFEMHAPNERGDSGLVQGMFATPDPLPPFGQCPHRVKQQGETGSGF